MAPSSQAPERVLLPAQLAPRPFQFSLGGIWAVMARVCDLNLSGPDLPTPGMHSRLEALGVPPSTRLLDLPRVLADLSKVTLRVRPDGQPCRHDLVGNFTGAEALRILRVYLKPLGYTLSDEGNIVRISAG